MSRRTTGPGARSPVGRIRAGPVLAGLALLAGVLAAPLAPAPARATEDASCAEAEAEPIRVEADRMTFVEGTGQVRLVGGVDARHAGRRLRADEVLWDRDLGRVEILGPFTVWMEDGDVLAGIDGTFDDTLQTGTIRQIEVMVRGGPGRLLAAEGQREASGDLLLANASYSPCPISDDDDTPAWRILASEVRHDVENQELVYTAPVLEIAGAPVVVLPFLRQPDPSVVRRSGLLTPSVSTNSAYGFAVRAPYFFAIAPDRSATLTPFVTSKDGVILEGEYRQLYASGDLHVETSLGEKTMLDPQIGGRDRSHGHMFLDYRRSTDGDYEMGGEINLASEKGYLRRYEISDQDRLRNRVFVERYTRESQLAVESVAFQTLRDMESSRKLAYTLPEASYHRTLPEAILDGDLRIGGDVRYLTCQGCRRTRSAGLEAEWQKFHAFRSGLVTSLHARVRGDVYAFGNQDGPEYVGQQQDSTSRTLPQAGIETSLPLLRVGAGGAHVVEPVVQAILAPRLAEDDRVPNEDSLDVEFDEHSLFARNRFSGRDSVETGNRGAYGLRYQYLARDGLAVNAVVGRVLRHRPDPSFPVRSGLRDRHSDVVGAWGLRFNEPFALRLNHRLRTNSSFNMRRNDFTLRGDFGAVDVAGTYLYVAADRDPEPDDTGARRFETRARGEVQTRVGIDFQERWRLEMGHRRDFENHRTIMVDAELSFAHECFDLLFTAERDFISSTDAPADTTLGLTLTLLSF